MHDSEQVLRNILQEMVQIRGTLDRLIRRVEELPHRFEMAEIHPLETMAVPPDFNEGPHFPGLG